LSGSRSGKPKALALISGGLDSSLAVAVCRELGVEVVGLHFENVFHAGAQGEESFAARSAKSLGVEMLVRDSTPMLMSAVRNPKFGYGRHLNPCMDCREHMMKVARGLLAEVGASFIISGEVLGQRPMSQRRDAIARIEREARVEGLVLRPLSAKVLPETLPEREGWVDREKLLGIRGRSRRAQYQLAEQLGVTVFSSPAGGCLLTDPGFSARMRDLLEAAPDFDTNDVELLKLGRHFRLSPDCKAVVGRDQEDNTRIEALAREGDVLVEVAAGHSPTTLIRGGAGEERVHDAAAITVRYSKSRTEPGAEVAVWRPSEGQHRDGAATITAAPMDEDAVDRLAVGRVGDA
jgi:tRNA U34 2-thiouridine synthase MnmA/TrmU